MPRHTRSYPSSRALPAQAPPVSQRPWQEIIDDTLVRATWRAGAAELDARIAAVLAPDSDRLASLRSLDAWVRAHVPDRATVGSYVQDEAIPAEQRTALVSDLAAGIGRIEDLLDTMALALGHSRKAHLTEDSASADHSGLVLDHPDAYIVEMSVRAQMSTVERRLADLADMLGADASTGVAA